MTSDLYMNMPKGTSFEDGVRVGPYFTTAQPTTSTNGFANPEPTRPALGNLSAPGAMLASIVSYALSPSGSRPQSIYTGNDAAIPANGYVPLDGLGDLGQGDNTWWATARRSLVGSGYEAKAAKLGFTAANAPNVYVMDYARCVSVELVGGVDPAVSFTVFGLDMYGQLLISSTQASQGDDEQFLNTNSAFLVVFAVKANVAVAANAIIGIQASNSNFGLPYYCVSSGPTLGGGYVLDDGRVLTSASIAGVPPIVAPTSETADVRGIFSTDIYIPADSIAFLNVSYYCPGFDNSINQAAAQGKPNMKRITMALQYGQMPFAGGAVLNHVAAEVKTKVKAEVKTEVKTEVKKKN